MESEQTTDTTAEKILDFPEGAGSELDLPPEYCHYRDEGCEFADNFLGHKSSCLNCPFLKCIYDEPGGRQRWLKRQRDREIIRLFKAEGKGVKELAVMFDISQRTVQRALKNYLSTSPPRSPSPCQGEGEDSFSEGLRPSMTPFPQPPNRKDKETGVKFRLDTPDAERR